MDQFSISLHIVSVWFQNWTCQYQSCGLIGLKSLQIRSCINNHFKVGVYFDNLLGKGKAPHNDDKSKYQILMEYMIGNQWWHSLLSILSLLVTLSHAISHMVTSHIVKAREMFPHDLYIFQLIQVYLSRDQSIVWGWCLDN